MCVCVCSAAGEGKGNQKAVSEPLSAGKSCWESLRSSLLSAATRGVSSCYVKCRCKRRAFAFSWFLTWEWQLFGKDSKVSNSHLLKSEKASLGKNKAKDTSEKEDGWKQPKRVPKVGKEAPAFLWDQETEENKPRWLSLPSMEHVLCIPLWNECCINDLATRKFEIMVSVPFLFLRMDQKDWADQIFKTQF